MNNSEMRSEPELICLINRLHPLHLFHKMSEKEHRVKYLHPESMLFKSCIKITVRALGGFHPLKHLNICVSTFHQVSIQKNFVGKLQSKNSDDKKSVGVLAVHIVEDPEKPFFHIGVRTLL